MFMINKSDMNVFHFENSQKLSLTMDESIMGMSRMYVYTYTIYLKMSLSTNVRIETKSFEKLPKFSILENRHTMSLFSQENNTEIHSFS